MKTIKTILVIASILSLQACARDETLRSEGLTLGAGDALARNSALQIIDPWPEGVEETDLSVPNARSNDKVDSTTVVNPPVSTSSQEN